MPWSIDCALYSLIFYHIGYCIKKYDLVTAACKNGYVYFILSAVSAYAIYSGPMELAVRKYGKFGSAIIGACCSAVLIYMLSKFVCRRFPRVISLCLAAIGRNTLYILIFHTLFFNQTVSLVQKLSLTSGYIYHYILTVALNIAVGTVIGCAFELIRSRLPKKDKLLQA